MTRMQFMLGLFVMGTMSLAGSFLAVHLLHSDAPLNAQEGDQPGKVKATAFELVDKEGNSRAKLDISEEGEVRFTLLDEEGAARVQMNSGGDRAYMSLLDRKGMARYIVAQDQDGTVMQTFADKLGRNRWIMNFSDEDEKSLMTFASGEGEELVTLMAGPDAPSTLILKAPGSGNELIQFAKDDQTSIQLKAGDGSLLNAVLGDGRPVIGLSKAENLRMRGMLNDEGEPEFLFLNKEREATWRAGSGK